MDENAMKVLADALWKYFHEKYLIPYLSDSVCYFRAAVTHAPSAGVIGIQRPFDSEVFLPYAWSASTLQAGDACTVLMFGDASNCIVIGDGALGEPGIYVTKTGLAQTTGSAADNAMSQDAVTTFVQNATKRYSYVFLSSDWTGSGPYTLTLSAATHGCGTDPFADVLVKNGTSYEKYYGYPSSGWKVSIDASGNITVTSGTAFSGKLKVSL